MFWHMRRGKKSNETTASGFGSHDCESNRKETSPRLHMAKSIFTHNSVQERLTPPYTGGHGRSSWAQGSPRGRNTHFIVSSLSANPSSKNCSWLTIQRVPLPSPRWRTHLSFISSRSDSYGIKSQACHGFAFPFKRLCTPGVYKTGPDKFWEKKLFSHQPDKCSHQAELEKQAQGVVSSPPSPLTWGMRHDLRNCESGAMETLVLEFKETIFPQHWLLGLLVLLLLGFYFFVTFGYCVKVISEEFCLWV